MIPLSKRAGVIDDIEGAVWDKSAGPLENLLRLAENLGIIFTGGLASIVLMGLEAAGLDFGLLGRALDRYFGYKTLDDLIGANPNKLAEAGVQIIQAQPQQETEGFGSPLGAGLAPLSLRKNAAGRSGWSLKPQSYWSAGRGIGKSSKLLGGLRVVFGFLFGWLANPSSKLAKILRAIGVVGAISFHNKFETAQPDERQKAELPAAKLTQKQKLESVVDQILGA